MPTITIQGLTFTISPRYAAGHQVNAEEASVLNAVLYDNLRNNFAKKVKEAATAGVPHTILQQQFTAYATAYKFSLHGGTVSSDPVAREAQKIARQAVAEHYAKKGQRVDPQSEVFKTQVEKVAGLAKVRSEAERRVNAAREVALSTLVEDQPAVEDQPDAAE